MQGTGIFGFFLPLPPGGIAVPAIVMTIMAMRKIEGFSIRKIAQVTGKHRNTVKRYFEKNEFPKYRDRRTKETAAKDMLRYPSFNYDKWEMRDGLRR